MDYPEWLATMISVLCPTRMRRDTLTRSIASLASSADSQLEILLAVDADDPTDYRGLGVSDIVVFRERRGYRNLHAYYNALAAEAEGDWLLLWNDDALMATGGWDRIVESHEQSVVLSPHTVHDPLCTFPIVPRRFAQEIGHFSLNAHCDSWWQEIGEQLGILIWPDIRVDHRRADVTGENNDSVYAERSYQTEAFNSPEMTAARFADAEAIRNLLRVAA